MNGRKIKRRGYSLVSVFFFVLVVAFYFVNDRYDLFGQQGDGERATVTTVNDGDTVSVIMNGKHERIRLAGIDAPEVGQRPWGAESKRYLETLISYSGRKVKVEFDVEKKDKYGRLLAYLWTKDGRLINLLMVRAGFAMLYTIPPNVKYAGELRAAQLEARTEKAGIWAENGLKERPRDYRKTHPRT